ncbi:DUF6318 family protein [Demequina sp.]|uniref:DUF6318 family protein n=1 Tax=Demequina sp. TaxID=2050685 RepID=UPI0025BDD5CD|nr:DUF6318 family protein [Demequina sp.]
MTRLLRGAAVAVLVGGATVVLTSCSGDPGATPTETPPSTSTVVVTTPSPTPTPSVTPEEELLEQIPENARGEDFQSATHFARFFLAMYPDLFAKDSDTQLFEYLSGETCRFCEKAMAGVAEARELDAYSVGGEVTFPDVLARGGLQEDGFWYVADRFQAAAVETFGPDGDLLDGAPPYSGEARFRLDYRDGHWRVDEIDLEFDDA